MSKKSEKSSMILQFPEEQKILELGRKSFHTLIGSTVITIFIIFGRYYTTLIVLTALLVGILLSELALRGVRIPVITDALVVFDRPEDIRFRPGFGVMTLFVGFTTVLVFPYIPLISPFIQGIPLDCGHSILGSAIRCWKMDQWALVTLGGMFPAAFADSASTIGGVYLGRHKWPHNKRKSIEGSLLNLFFAIVAISLVAPLRLAVIAGLFVMLVESMPHVDDNMNIPIVSATVLAVGFMFLV